jgi:thioredoxin 1
MLEIMNGSEGNKRSNGMGMAAKGAILIVLAGLVTFVILAKDPKKTSTAQPPATTETAVSNQKTPVAPAEAKNAPLPKLIDLGADKCIPCKMMAPILEELKTEYQGRMEVVFIDVWKNPGAGDAYGVQTIPTQIFFDPSGKELFRHTGFFGKEDILAKWKELGIEFAASPETVSPVAAGGTSPQ